MVLAPFRELYFAEVQLWACHRLPLRVRSSGHLQQDFVDFEEYKNEDVELPPRRYIRAAYAWRRNPTANGSSKGKINKKRKV